jgi:hypothetical protein
MSTALLVLGLVAAQGGASLLTTRYLYGLWRSVTIDNYLECGIHVPDGRTWGGSVQYRQKFPNLSEAQRHYQKNEHKSDLIGASVFGFFWPLAWMFIGSRWWLKGVARFATGSGRSSKRQREAAAQEKAKEIELMERDLGWDKR